MQFFISHLIDTQSFLKLLERYPIGIESINFSVSSILDEGISAVKQYQEELGPLLKEKPLILHGPFLDLCPASFDSKIRSVTMERFEEVYTIAKQLGASKIIFHTCFIPQIYYPEAWLQNSISFWTEFMSTKDASISICIENVFEDDFVPLLELIKQVNHPALKICLDIGHINAYSSITFQTWLTNLHPFIDHFHLHNNDGTKDQHSSLLNGTLPIKELLPLIYKLCPNATATLEMADLNALETSLQLLIDFSYL